MEERLRGIQMAKFRLSLANAETIMEKKKKIGIAFVWSQTYDWGFMFYSKQNYTILSVSSYYSITMG